MLRPYLVSPRAVNHIDLGAFQQYKHTDLLHQIPINRNSYLYYTPRSQYFDLLPTKT